MKIKKVVHHGKIRWRVNDPCGANGKRQRKFFETKEDAERYARQQKADRHAYGIHFTSIPPSERAALGYCQDSALYIWGDFTQCGIAEKIHAALADAGENGLTRSQLNDALGGRIPADEFSPELEKMISKDEVIQFFKETKGRRATIYKLRQ
jgi:hypothetical protein